MGEARRGARVLDPRDDRPAGIPDLRRAAGASVAAAVTDRIDLFANVAIGPVYEKAFLAKAAAGLDQISEGRFVLGLAVGWRDEDYRIAGAEYAGRGRQLDELIEFMQRAWHGEILEGATKRLTPTPVNGESVPIAIGGHSEVAFARAAQYGMGWTAGGASPDEVKGFNESARAAWDKAGREGSPKLWTLTYFALGDGGRETATEYLSDYYGDWGPGMAQQIPADADGIRGAVGAFEAAGSDELIFNPVSSDMRQLDLLAEALGDALA